MQENIKELIEISRFYGSNKNYVIAGGGNTSFKISDVILVKASGANLSNIEENSFVALDREKLSLIASKTYSLNPHEREEQVKNDLMNSRLFPEKGQRPSVETSMHEIINYPFVVHTHPTVANSLLCSRNAEKIINELFKTDAIFLKYTDPGFILFKKVKEQLDHYRSIHHGNDPHVIFLENHGVFVSANTINEIRSIYNEIETKIEKLFKENLTINSLPTNELIIETGKTIAAIMSEDSSKVISIRYNSLIDGFCKSCKTYERIALPFTPDNIVYCKAYSIFIEKTGSVNSIIDDFQKQLENYIKEHGYKPKVILIRNFGLLAVDDSTRSAEIVLDVFEDMMKVSFGSMNFGGPKFMSPSDIEFIEKWEVENYRRSIIKAV